MAILSSGLSSILIGMKMHKYEVKHVEGGKQKASTFHAENIYKLLEKVEAWADVDSIVEINKIKPLPKFGPDREGSSMCESGSIASGGTKEYCSCDYCF